MSLGGDPAEATDNVASSDYYDAGETDRSLVDDVEALIDDGKTYLEAELAFQRTRAAFVADGAKTVAMFGGLALAFAILALIGLAVGLIIAFTPLITAWGATAVVVGLLLIGAFLCVRAASKRWTRVMAAISGEAPK